MRKSIENFNLYIVKDYDQMSKEAARLVAAQIRLNPDSNIGFATGSTPLGMYKELVSIHKKEGLDFSQITSFNLDEYYPIHPLSKESYHFYMMTHLFKHININHENINIPNGMGKNVEIECKKYEDKINQRGGIDLQILGIGPNGHIGFNEPNLKFEAKTHLITLEQDTIEANARFFKHLSDVPKQAITMGIKTIMHTKKIILLASGRCKSRILKEALVGSIVPKVPASILQLHQDVTVICDQEAGQEIIKVD